MRYKLSNSQLISCGSQTISNGWIIKLHSRIQMSSLTQICSLIAMRHCVIQEDVIFDQEILGNYATCIFDAKYEQFNIAKLTVNPKHLTPSQCHGLHHVLSKCNPNQKVPIGLLPCLKAVHHHACMILESKIPTLKRTSTHG